MAFYYLEVIVTDPHDPTLPEVLVQSIELTPENMSLQPGDMGHFTAAISPENTSNPGLFWVSSDLDIVRVVDPTGGVVLGVNPGEATIFAMAMDGSEVWASATVVVEPLGFMATIWGALISGVEWFLGCFGYQRPVTWPSNPIFTGANNLQQFLEINGLIDRNGVPNFMLSSTRVDIVVENNTITITTGFTYSGAYATAQWGTTFQQAFEAGIRRVWNRTYPNIFGRYNVTINIVIDNSRPESRRTPVEIINSLGTSSATHMIPWSFANANFITMYRAQNTSRLDYFEWTAAHEFAHILGLYDWHNRPDPRPVSIMNEFNTNVQIIDVEAVIRAFSTMQRQLP